MPTAGLCMSPITLGSMSMWIRACSGLKSRLSIKPLVDRCAKRQPTAKRPLIVAGGDAAAPGHYEGTLRRAQSPCRRLDLLWVARGQATAELAPAGLRFGHEEVRGERKRDRPRPRSAEEVESALHGSGDRGTVPDRLRPATNGLEALDLVGYLVERAQALADERCGYVGHEGEDRLRAGEGLHERREHVGGARARGDDDHPGVARGAGVAVGHETRALLVAGEDVRDVVLAKERVVNGEIVNAGQTEDVPDALGAQHFHHPLTAGAELSHDGPFARAGHAAAPRQEASIRRLGCLTIGGCDCNVDAPDDDLSAGRRGGRWAGWAGGRH